MKMDFVDAMNNEDENAIIPLLENDVIEPPSKKACSGEEEKVVT